MPGDVCLKHEDISVHMDRFLLPPFFAFLIMVYNEAR